MPTLFNTLTAAIVPDGNSTRIDYFSPSGQLHHSAPIQGQPSFGRQKSVMYEGILYSVTWKRTPSTPTLPR